LPDKEFDDEFEALLAESARVAAEYDASDEGELVDPTQELSERHSLRRVKGFSTQLQDITEVENRELQLEKVVLVGVWTEGTSEMAENSLAELKALAETAGSEVMELSSVEINQIPLHILVQEKLLSSSRLSLQLVLTQ